VESGGAQRTWMLEGAEFLQIGEDWTGRRPDSPPQPITLDLVLAIRKQIGQLLLNDLAEF
jgi:hypothetical protein